MPIVIHLDESFNDILPQVYEFVENYTSGNCNLGGYDVKYVLNEDCSYIEGSASIGDPFSTASLFYAINRFKDEIL